MPQLISHRDGFGWQTPDVSKMLDLPQSRSHQTGTLRSLATDIVRHLAELGTPVRLKNIAARSSHTRYLLSPDQKGDGTAVTLEDLQQVFTLLIDKLDIADAALTEGAHGDVAMYVRRLEHQPPTLRELLEQKVFLERNTYTSTVAGMDLQQQAVVIDVASQHHVSIVGVGNERIHAQLGILVPLMLFNSPAYLRVAIVGDRKSLYQHMMGSPHILGNVVSKTSDVRRLLDGLLKHITQRRRQMQKRGTSTLYEHNLAALSDKDMKPLPHIMIMLDVAALSDWHRRQNEWLVPLHQVLSKGIEVGVHVVMSTAVPAPARIAELFDVHLVLDYGLYPENVPQQFVDGMLTIDKTQTPIEIPKLDSSELVRLVTYWQNMKTRRNLERETKGEPQSTGDTGLLTLRNDMLPSASTGQLMNLGTGRLKRQTSEISEPIPPSDGNSPVIVDEQVASAQALAAYLGWLSHGPLEDVLHMDDTESQETLKILLRLGILEPGEGPVYRFSRLTEPPTRI